jgi:2-keto-4-pentenoate hydratase/2-oxohepta-3-ene-1,7-dioic acid hydratase in catechol pathway
MTTITLSFGNGPDPGVTPHVLDTLRRHNLRTSCTPLKTAAPCSGRISRRTARRWSVAAWWSDRTLSSAGRLIDRATLSERFKMKLCRVGPPCQEKPALIDGKGQVRDLSSIVSDIDGAALSPARLAELARIAPESLPLVQGEFRYGVPVAGSSKFICIGLNYSEHAAESNLPIPSEPIIFLKAPSAICGPNDDTIVPLNSTKLDWEVELGVVIGSVGRNVPEERALDIVAGYCVVNDVSERAFQLQSSQWDKGKGCDSFGPTGPWIVTPDEVPDPQALGMWLSVNGTRMQDGSTRTMIFGVKPIISYVSRYMTLMPGDIIATGTPSGVGMGKKPEPVWLKPGDVVELGIEGLGAQRQTVVPYR